MQLKFFRMIFQIFPYYFNHLLIGYVFRMQGLERIVSVIPAT